MDDLVSSSAVSRRRFLRQSFAFSALATLGSLPAVSSGPSPNAAAADLLMIGDWGYDTDLAPQSDVARGMRHYAQQHRLKTQALLMLGDNWYGALDGGAHSARWQTQFEAMYPSDIFDCPAYAIAGNHDYERWPDSKVAAELEYARIGKTNAAPTRWTMPSLWYRFEFPTKNPLITFLAIDSNMPFSDGSASKGRTFTLTSQQQADQLAWLERELKRPRTTPFLAVMRHHPIYTDGAHGDHPVLIRDWDPLLHQHNVHLYLAGHDHDLQHLEFEGHPTSFFYSGGGGADLGDLKIDPSKRGPYAQKVYGFSHLSVTSEQMTLRHLDAKGNTLYAFKKTPEGKIAIVS